MKNQVRGVEPEELARERESVRDFISTAVHDLREPLRAIRAGSQLLIANCRDLSDESVARGTRSVLDGVNRMEALIHDIAEYYYEEVREPDTKETELEDVLREAQDELADELKGSGATITHDPLPAVMGNSSSLTAVLRCLIGNACKFRGEAVPHIHIGAMRRGPEWIVSVKDNGMGFDPAHGERIFRPFERLNGKQYPGSGLGLTLAKRIVEQHGGRIWAESQPGEGSTLQFSLPLTR